LVVVTIARTSPLANAMKLPSWPSLEYRLRSDGRQVDEINDSEAERLMEAKKARQSADSIRPIETATILELLPSAAATAAAAEAWCVVLL